MKMMTMHAAKRVQQRPKPEHSTEPVLLRIAALAKSVKHFLLAQIIPTALIFIVTTWVFAMATKLIVEAKPTPETTAALPAPAEPS